MPALDDLIDPTLKKKMDLMKDLLIQSASAEVPFTPYLSKARNKKITKSAYQTHSQGLRPSPSR
jgi:hypothetical protein